LGIYDRRPLSARSAAEEIKCPKQRNHCRGLSTTGLRVSVVFKTNERITIHGSDNIARRALFSRRDIENVLERGHQSERRAPAQVHSSAYKNASQLPSGDILVVGAGNTGMELALEAAAHGHRVWLAGRDVGHMRSMFRFANGRLFWFLVTRIFTTKRFIGRRIRASMRAGHAGPIVRIQREEIAAAGIEGTRNGLPQLQDGRTLDVAGVVWCAGFGLDFSWIKLPILDADGYPRHDGGRVVSEPGLYFVGLPFLNSLSSSTLVGVGRDAALIASWVTMRAKTGQAALPTRVATVQA
jgi:putative flavoprotein involved in K+ transport